MIPFYERVYALVRQIPSGNVVTPIESPLIQRLLLEEEGVVFDAEGRVDLSIYRWQR